MQIGYLRARLTSNNRADEEMKHQLLKTRRIAGCMNNFIWNNKYLTQEAQTRVYKSTIHSVISYASETKPDTAATQRKRQTIEMIVLRRVLGKTKYDRLPNNSILL